MPTYVHAYIHACIHAYMHTCSNVCIHAGGMHTYMHACITYIHICCTHARTNALTHEHTNTHTCSNNTRTQTHKIVCALVFVHLHSRWCLHSHAMRALMDLDAHACAHVGTSHKERDHQNMPIRLRIRFNQHFFITAGDMAAFQWCLQMAPVCTKASRLNVAKKVGLSCQVARHIAALRLI